MSKINQFWNEKIVPAQKQIKIFGTIALFCLFSIASIFVNCQLWDKILSIVLVLAWCCFYIHKYHDIDQEPSPLKKKQLIFRLIISVLGVFVGFAFTPSVPTYLFMGVIVVWLNTKILKYVRLLMHQTDSTESKLTTAFFSFMIICLSFILLKMTFLGY